MNNIKAPRKTASLAAQLVDSLRSHIAAGEWPVGTRIPSEHDLVEQLGVGRTTLREALGALVHLGLLEARVGDGTYVRASSELQSVMVRRASSAERDEVLELRAVLEEHASGAAARRRSQDDIDKLRDLLGDVERATASGDMPAVVGVDGLFHRTVVQTSGNALLIEVYDYLGTALASTLGGLPWDADAADGHARLHVRLVDAIEAGDEIGARHTAAAIVRLNHDHTTETPVPEAGTPQTEARQ
ncbi:FadR/GntR family transcriptional regulator [Streptomyces sp. NPDC050560]|uniref:FadR/GntR family transcriptional regulator n=1 Tax=Streptomyces sp. NPDC050560 TaxID=3365630 RepID=UPI0037881A28